MSEALLPHVGLALKNGLVYDKSLWINESAAHCSEYYDREFVVGRKLLLVVGDVVGGHSVENEVFNSAENEQGIRGGIIPCEDQVCTFQGQNVSYCLSERGPEHCALQFELRILALVVVCGSVKLVAMIMLIFVQDDSAFITTGDAVASFLDTPDDHTRGMCLMARTDTNWLKHGKCTHPLRWSPVVTTDRSSLADQSIAIGIIWIHVLACAAVISTIGISSDNGGAVAWTASIGTTTPQTTMTSLPGDRGSRLILTALVGNLPQLVTSIANVTTSHFFTTMLSAEEGSQYVTKRRGLRVSSPTGHQRSTYWLQLPFRFSIPLHITWILLHWLASQSSFLVRIAYHNRFEEMNLLTAVGVSFTAAVYFIVVDFIVLAVMIGFGKRRLRSAMPLAGSCSATISAACQSPQIEIRASVEPVKWDVVPGQEVQIGSDMIGHCSFSSGPVAELVVKRIPAGYEQTASKSG